MTTPPPPRARRLPPALLVIAVLVLSCPISALLVLRWVDGPGQVTTGACGPPPTRACPAGFTCGWGEEGFSTCLRTCASTADCPWAHTCEPRSADGGPTLVCRLEEDHPTGLRLWLGRKLAAWQGVHDHRYSEY